MCDLPLCSETAPMVREVAPALALQPRPLPGFKPDLHLSLELVARVALALRPRPRPCAGLTTLWPSVV